MVLSIFVAMTVLWYCPGLIPPLTHSCVVGGPKMDLKKKLVGSGYSSVHIA